MKLLIRLFVLLWLTVVSALHAQTDLRGLIANEVKKVDGSIGVALKHIENGDTLSYNGKQHFPMQSVYKVHLGIAVLKMIDQGKLSLNQKIRITQSDLLQNSWSPIAEKFPNGNVELTVRELLSYSISQSDNSACDILFRLVGGPAVVEKLMHRTGVEEVSIKYTEAEMHKDWNAQYSNSTTPLAMVKLLDLIQRQRVLRAETNTFLINTMSETVTGQKRIKGALPGGVMVAHKTGMSGLSEEGVRGAINDVGIITLPNGTHLAIAFFVSNTKTEDEKVEAMMAAVSRLAYDYFIGK